MDFRNSFLSVIDRAANSAKNLVNDLSDSFESFDFDSQFESLLERRDALIEKGNGLIKDLGDLLKQVKESMTDFSVTVPFDGDSGEKFTYKIDENQLTVEVTFNDENSSRCSKTTVVIPDNCDVKKLAHSVNKTAKSLTITIPKVVEKPKKETKAAKPKTGKKTVKKSADVKPALTRDSRGRFVRQQ